MPTATRQPGAPTEHGGGGSAILQLRLQTSPAALTPAAARAPLSPRRMRTRGVPTLPASPPGSPPGSPATRPPAGPRRASPAPAGPRRSRRTLPPSAPSSCAPRHRNPSRQQVLAVACRRLCGGRSRTPARTRMRRKVRLTLLAISLPPSRTEKTRSSSRHASPAASLSSACCAFCRRSASTAPPSRANVRTLRARFGVPSTMREPTRRRLCRTVILPASRSASDHRKPRASPSRNPV